MADNIAELKAWISANFQKFDQIAGWVKSNFFIRGNYQQTSAGTPSAGLPIVLDSTGKIDITFYDSADVGLLGTANTWTKNNAFNSTATTGSALSSTRNLTATSTDSPVVSIKQDHASDDQVALQVTQDANARVADFIGDGTSARTAWKVAGLSALAHLAAYTGNYLQFAMNRDVTGVFSDTNKTAATINIFADNGDSSITFYTSPTNNTTPVEAMRIDKNGNVGIGVTPSYLLHVRKDQNTSTVITVQNGTDGNLASALFQAINSAGDVMQFGVYPASHSYGAIAGRDGFMYSGGNIVLMSDAASGVIKFATGSNAEKARLDASGNLGVGVTTVQGKLHVHDGTGGNMHRSVTGVVGSEVELIADGTGDVAKACNFRFIAAGSGGTILTSNTGALATPAAASVTQVISTLTFKLYSTGQLVVFRSAGVETYSVTVDIVWQ